MKERGFSLVELVVVIAIIGTLISLATLQFRRYSQQANIEKQVREIYSDLMDARSQALLQKVDRSVKVESSLFSVYQNRTGAEPPIRQKALAIQVASNNTNVVFFDTRGVANVAAPKIICVGPSGNSASVDSIRIQQTMIQTGKLSGGTCDSANFTAK